MPRHETIRTRPHSMLILAALVVAASIAPARDAAARQAPQPATLDAILAQVATYDGGIESAPLWTLRDHVLARKDDPVRRAECEGRLIRFLQAPATPAAKMAVGRLLRLIAGDAAVPPLSALLGDERTVDIAVYVLQAIPGRAADEALLQALAKLTGPSRVAVIATLGERRVADAVARLVPLLARAEVAGPAVVALGSIGSAAAADALLKAMSATESTAVKPTMAASILTCAERRLAAGDRETARRLYEAVAADATLPAPLRAGGVNGRITTGGSQAGAFVMSLLEGGDADLQEVAIGRMREVIGPDAVGRACAVWPRLPAASQVKLLAVFAGYPPETVRQTVLGAARSDALAVRLAAFQALRSVGGPSAVPLLAEVASRTRGVEQAAARASLGALGGRDTDEAVLSLLASRPAEGVEAELLRAVADRGVFAANQVAAAALRSSSARVRREALDALRTVGTPSDIPAVLDLLLASADENERTQVESTAVALARKIADPDGRAGTVRTRLAGAKGAEPRSRLIGLLGRIGDASALPLLRAASVDSEPEVAEAAVRALAAWPTSAARDDVLRLARDSRNQTHRLLAIQGLVRIVGLDRYRDPAAVVADLRLAASVAWRPEEYTLVLSALVRFPCADALELATGFLSDTAVEAEAKVAVAAIRKRLPAAAERR